MDFFEYLDMVERDIARIPEFTHPLDEVPLLQRAKNYVFGLSPKTYDDELALTDRLAKKWRRAVSLLERTDATPPQPPYLFNGRPSDPLSPSVWKCWMESCKDLDFATSEEAAACRHGVIMIRCVCDAIFNCAGERDALCRYCKKKKEEAAKAAEALKKKGQTSIFDFV